MKDKILFEDEYLSLHQADGWYTYAHMSRTEPSVDGSGQGVAILVYTRDTDGRVDKVLGRFENCLPHKSEADGCTSITGGVDKGSTPLLAVIHELYEEAGYKDDSGSRMDLHIQTLGSVRLSKQEDSIWHLFAFDATGKTRREESVGDGTKGEEGAYCAWVPPYLAIGCKCPLVATMMARAGLIQNL